MDTAEQLEKLGYIILHDVITPEECEAYKALLERDYEKYAPMYAGSGVKTAHGLNDKSTQKVVYNLHNKDMSWFKLFEHPEVLKIITPMLTEGSYKESDPFYLNNISARCPLKGDKGQQLHLDSGIAGINYCIKANVLWALDDFTPENGATRLVPGTHKRKEFTEDGKVYDEEILAIVKKGSVIIFDSNLWHGGGGNTNGASRWALALGYARWFIKPSYDYMKNTPQEIFNQMTLDQKKLLGFNLTSPKDEFTRLRRQAQTPDTPEDYNLPK